MRVLNVRIGSEAASADVLLNSGEIVTWHYLQNHCAEEEIAKRQEIDVLDKHSTEYDKATQTEVDRDKHQLEQYIALLEAQLTFANAKLDVVKAAKPDKP